jgi:hypothetical protein
MKPIYILVTGLILLSASIFIGLFFRAITDTWYGFLMGLSISVLFVGVIKLLKFRKSAAQKV